MARYLKTIFFTNGMAPSEDDYKKAEKIGPGVVFRNARKIVPGAPLENCDAVAGAVPPDYARVYSGKPEENDKNIFVRPAASRHGSGAPDDMRPGTVHDGLAHESGTGSAFSGDPYKQQAEQQARTIEQRAGTPVWDKNPELKKQKEGEAAEAPELQTVPAGVQAGWPTSTQKAEPKAAETKSETKAKEKNK